ncbi:PQQ-dependent sugar dehydrogenase [Arcticibacter eurypsychrophilus]|uniref:PQQ-dependent sugar dehydrogenase n=1 Tax=Arcticibacter eurypsychrophilus TaxID=1434752 RepID=UPI001FDFC6C8|nr:PQQ-dependent sugar dehydrogenase [Arcticibacter eurypsychrophilus]
MNLLKRVQTDKSASLYLATCSGCHGEKMNAFVDRKWKFGNSKEDLFKSIKNGHPNEGMPSFKAAFTDKEIYALADYILTGIKNVDQYTIDEKPSSSLFKTEKMSIRLDTVAKGMQIPWSIAFLPGKDMLVTDKVGKLYQITEDGSKKEITGVPEVVAEGQGGLMDVILDPSFATNKLIYLSYSKPKNSLATTAIMQAKLSGDRLTEQKDIFIAEPYSRTRHHYGSRMVFGRDGFLYFSVGERGNEKENPQEIKGNDLGKIHRIKTDGSPAPGNPFAKTPGAEASIYSYGHRNPQGLAVDPKTGVIWSNEHGPRGGDELNIIKPGQNYGWPVITYGINYDGKIMSPISAKEGMAQPQHYWIPSIATSGIAFVSGNKYPAWKDNILSGSLRFKYLNRSVMQNDKVTHEEILFKNIGRLRDVRMGPDGFIYIAVESPGTIYRLVPLPN